VNSVNAADGKEGGVKLPSIAALDERPTH